MRKSLRKRKATNPEGDSTMTSMHLVTWQKKKQISTADSKRRGVFQYPRSCVYINSIRTQAGSKKVKIYENLRGLDDHLQNGLDSTFQHNHYHLSTSYFDSHILWRKVSILHGYYSLFHFKFIYFQSWSEIFANWASLLQSNKSLLELPSPIW